jgi:hypothetical protein
MLLFAALGIGRPTILAKPEWKTMLRQCCKTEEQLQEQLLYDVLADCTVLASERDKLFTRRIATRENVSNQIEIIRTHAEQLCEQLRNWRRIWGANPANAYIEIPAIPGTQVETTDANATSLAPTDLVFATITSALMLMLYNIALINLLKMLISLPSPLQQSTPRNDLVAVAHSAVLDIYRCIPNPTSADFRKELHASPVVHWAIQTAKMMLQGDESAEAKLLMGMLERKSKGNLAENMDEV